MLIETPYAAGIVPCAIDLAVTKTTMENTIKPQKKRKTLKGENCREDMVKSK